MKKKEIKKKFAETFSFPEELVCDISKISIEGREKFNIINYKSLVEYEENVIRINTKEAFIKIEGENLIIKNITDDEITVSGEIKKITFE